MHAKTYTVKINLSSTFMPRCVCKYCGGKPSFYSYSYKKRPTPGIEWLRRFSEEIVVSASGLRRDWFCNFDIKEVVRSELSFNHRIINYVPSITKNRGSFLGYFDYVDEQLLCKCGKTKWTFNINTTQFKAEVINRKARSSYPRKFLFQRYH